MKPATFLASPGLVKLRDTLEARVLDQPLAIDGLMQELQAREWKMLPAGRPSVMLLVGPSNSGKSLTAEIVGRLMPRRPVLSLNMATMTNRNEGFALTGLRVGYQDSAPGRLTRFVHENPSAVVILENVEQAHASVQNLLLPLFSEGALQDEHGFEGGGRAVSFADVVVLMTTRLGAAVHERRDYPELYERDPDALIALLREEIARSGRPRKSDDPEADASTGTPIGSYLAQCRILPFRALGLPALRELARRTVEGFSETLAGSGVAMSVDDMAALTTALALSRGPDFNPVELQRTANRLLLDAFVADVAKTGTAPRAVRVSTTDPDGTLARLRAADEKLLQRGFFRRSERLELGLEASRTQDAGILSLRLTATGVERIPVSEDFGDDGGITIEAPHLRFADVFGHHYIKDRLQEVVRLLSKPYDPEGNAISLPRGMLLFGQPGTGKTMLAKALAAEAELPFIAVAGPDLLDVRRIKHLFRLARRYAPSMVFIDEIDALGVRGRGGVDVCINQLLVEIDGFDESRDGSVFVIAATNFPAKVDPALTRSGRLDLRLEVPLLDPDARRHLLRQLERLPHIQAIDLDALVALSAGMSGADLQKLVREATLDLVRRPRPAITNADVLELLNVIKYGARVERPPLREQLAATAYHEAGHAVTSMALDPGVRIEQISIVARRDMLGFTAYNDEGIARRNLNRREVTDLICVALAGRIAESRKFPESAGGGPDAGASSDLERATDLAWRAVTEWGLDDDFGWISLRPFDDRAPDAWRDKASLAAQSWIDRGRGIAERTLEANWSVVEALAQRLLAQESVDGAALDDLRKSIRSPR